MKTGQELYIERLERLKKAIALEKPDRIPVALSGPGFIKYGEPSAKLVDFIRRPRWADEMVLKSRTLPVLNEIDTAPAVGLNYATFGAIWYAGMRLPGRDLPEDALWNIDEKGPMTEADYDVIIEKGWKAVSAELVQRAGYKPEDLAPDFEYAAGLQKKVVEELGCVGFFGSGVLVIPTFETLSGARMIQRFLRDIHRIPEKVSAALEVMERDIHGDTGAALDAMKPMLSTIGGTRAGSDFISRKHFEKFYWPFLRNTINLMIEKGTVAFLHMDSNWEGFLPYFTEFPKGKVIFDPDSLTNIFKIKEVLGDRMCITGDVPPALLAVGTPDEVYNYARKLVDELGPSGFVQNSGCDVPANAPLENVKAVVYSVTGK